MFGRRSRCWAPPPIPVNHITKHKPWFFPPHSQMLSGWKRTDRAPKKWFPHVHDVATRKRGKQNSTNATAWLVHPYALASTQIIKLPLPPLISTMSHELLNYAHALEDVIDHKTKWSHSNLVLQVQALWPKRSNDCPRIVTVMFIAFLSMLIYYKFFVGARA